MTETDSGLQARASGTGARGPEVTAPGFRPAAWRRWPAVVACAAIVFLAAHLIQLGPARGSDGSSGLIRPAAFDLDDIDAVNFAMGVQRFDIAEHRPHPPGYPIYVLLGKLSSAVLAATTPGSGANRLYAASLGFWGALAGALAAFPLFRLSRLIAGDDGVAAGATVITLSCPLYWFTASRPLSDVPGLAAALAVQVILATAFVRQQGWRDRAVTPAELASTGRLIVLGAFLAGFVIGLRSQTLWLTMPLLVVVIADRAGRAAAGAIVGSSITFAAGVLLWLVPVAVVSGGPVAYWHALTSQAGEDLEGVDMLLTSTRPVRRLAFNLYETFVLPWAAVPLAVVVLTLAVAGAIVMFRRSRRGLVLLAGLAAPYAVFHLLYQENATTRYALPLVPVAALLCARGLQTLGGRAAGMGAVAVAAGGLYLAVPAALRAASPYVPVFELFDAFAARQSRIAGGSPGGDRRAGEPIVAMHRRAFTETKRAREWRGPAFPWTLLPAPRGHEWLGLVEHWRGGGDRSIYFVGDPRRTDLALIDPASRRFNGRYAWPFATFSTFVGGARPGELDWWVIDGIPGWFLGEGWALTPETAGVANQDGKGPAAPGGAVGWLRRRPGALRIVIGGRNLGAVGSAPVRFTAALDGRALDSWDVVPSPGFFLRAIDVPAGGLAAPPGPPVDLATRFAELRVTAAAAADSGAPIAASVEQFDAQSPDAVLFGFDAGWHEDEYNPGTGARWRWASRRAELRIWNAGHAVRVRMAVESPLQTFEEAPIVILSAGSRELARVVPRDGFTLDVRVPAEALAAADGRLTLTTSQVFVPADNVGPADPRRNDRRALGLRVWSVAVARE